MSIFSATDRTLSGPSEENAGQPSVSIPLYVGGLLVLLSGILAVAYQMVDQRFTQFTVVLTVVGVACSYFLRRVGVPTRWVKIGALGLCTVFIYAIQGRGPFGAIIPAEAQASSDMLLACALALTATFCSFLLVTDDAVIFTCVFTLALIGLTGTVNINLDLILCFLLFLASAVFLLVHQNYLKNRPRYADPATERAALFRLLPAQVMMTLACGVGAVVIGFMLAIPLQMVGRNLSLATIIRRLTVPAGAITPGLTGRLGALDFNDPQRFEVGLGPVPDDQTVVMTVQGRKSFYWRGRTYDTYTTTGWESSSYVRDSRQMITPRRVRGSRDNVFDLPPLEPLSKVETYTHRFFPVGGWVHPMYSAAEPIEVRAALPRIFMRMDRTLNGPRGGNLYGMTEGYEVVSRVSTATPADLQSAPSRLSTRMQARYVLQGPNDLHNPALEALAKEAVAGHTTTYARAEAIRSFVAERCVYSLESPAIPRNRDVAEFFLNESKTGYCDLYATAVAILCRYADIPARVATGFVPGTATDKPDTYTLRQIDRHAWAEVYFEGYGWVPFDASATTSLAATAEEQERRNVLLAWWRKITANPLPILLALIGIGAFTYVVKTELWDRWVLPRYRKAPAGPAGEILVLYRKALRPLARRGLRRSAMTTPGAFAAQVRAELGPEASAPLETITGLLEKALYSPDGVGPDAVTEARRVLAEHAERLRRLPRRQERKADGRHEIVSS